LLVPGAPTGEVQVTICRPSGLLDDLPAVLYAHGEADLLRDEGAAYAAKLRAAGVPVTSVRYNGTIRDFVMLNALRDTSAAKAAIAQGGEFLHALLWG
jgi:acetyl esterase